MQGQMKRTFARHRIGLIVVLLALCLLLTSCGGKDYSGTYKGSYNVFSLTLTLRSDGTYTFKQYESLTGGITESGKYKVEGSTIYYYNSSGSSLKYTGEISGNKVTVGSLTMYK